MDTWLAFFRRLGGALLLAPALAWAQQAPAPATPKVLRIPFVAPETGFDPAQVSDLYSNIAISHIFESPYEYDHLARPFKIKPATAAAMPEISPDFRTYTVRLKPGIFFSDDPAFKGRKRELVAADYVYAIKRLFDPALKSPSYTGMNEEGIIGLDALREDALKAKKPFDYDREVEGLRAIDRYTLQIRLEAPRPRFMYVLTDLPGMAREVVEHYGDRIMEHPVGTGPFRLTQWRRSSLMVFERNPNYREVLYDAEPNADDVEGQALLARFKGRRLPMVDRVEVSVVEESQPRWLAFLNNEFDIVGVPLEFANVAAPNGELAPHLAKRGIRMYQGLASDVTLFYFNMEDPVVGGYTPQQVALRRAIGLATDVEREIRLARRGQAIPAQSGVAPHTYGYDPEFKSENSEFNLARAKALLELNGYIDRNGDGWRDRPDGQPLVIEYATQPDQISRQFDELWKKNMDALGVRLSFDVRKWPEQLKRARAGQLMLWQLGSSSTSPDGQGALQLAYGPGSGGSNLSRFKLEAFDTLYRRIDRLPDGPERAAAFRDAKKLMVAYMPYKFNVHRLYTDLTQPWVIGYRRPTFWRNQWHRMDVDMAMPRER
jgi:ABC-type transport system substrate-binding protein